MDVFSLSMAAGFTDFSFPIEKERIWFLNLVEKYFDEGLSVKGFWKTPIMRRTEPKRESVFFEIENSGILAVNSEFYEYMEQYFDFEKIELLPIETDVGLHYVLNVLNFIDCLNLSESKYTATKSGIITSYSLLEFENSKLSSRIFKVPQIPYLTFVDRELLYFCHANKQYGLEFDRNVNLIYYPEY